MALITEVRFAHEDGALADTLSALPKLTASVVRETSTTPGQNVYFFRLVESSPEIIRPVLENDHTVDDVTPVPAVDGQRLWKIQFTPETKLLGPEVTSEGGLVVDAHSSSVRRTPRGWRERWFFSDHEGVNNVWQHARAEGFTFEVLDLSQQLRSDVAHIGSNPLTEEQRTALVTAYEQGYFREPRQVSLEELAETLELSPSAVNGRLKRGLKSLIGTILAVEEPTVDASRLGDRDTVEYRSDPVVQLRADENDE
ncbi:helix-turn-helix domain-containing protein [Natrinema sp. 1APR25-10V2]|uniref:helix-turn-helix domain-containing protein n=1 Tax=Natrinema sp. 1APR25-10V2 TaxID=2951081 RepID=UPI00287565B5|nr:helix-turn-helix domain-containing protein [Natrinema sp. 1APR25-10V2]MDS0476202.1 helix-turn-helix domain-containing protein [Natrinema sp. 1APR25-10V2]